MNMRVHQKIMGVFLILLAVFISSSAQAEFITDKVVINVHSERFEQGTVLKKLSSGTAITVLMNDGAFSRIRTNDNVTGWIESKYITNEKPAQLEYLEMLARSKTLEAKLKAAEDKLSSQATGETEGIDLAELAELRKRAADAGWMRVELKKARDRVSELETKLKSNNKNVSSSQEELDQLREQKKLLEERLAAAVLVNEQQDTFTQEPSDATTTTDADEEGWRISIGWFLGSIVAAIIIGLIVGMTWLDMGEVEQAQVAFQHALDADPGDSAALFNVVRTRRNGAEHA
ncbi:TIGR04211 family SH3 domain-containing protein, partial [Kaarinaea lacus]